MRNALRRLFGGAARVAGRNRNGSRRASAASSSRSSGS